MIGSAASWGAGTALAWGLSDYVARFAGRSVGAATTTFGVMVVGLVTMLLFVWLAGEPIVWQPEGFWLLAGSGVGTAFATLLLFLALTRGPLSLASPVVASYPAIAVPISVALGARPSLAHWAAMAATVAGVWLVARAVARAAPSLTEPRDRHALRLTVLIAIGSATLFALAIIAADKAIEQYGPWQTLLASRIVGVVVMAGWLLAHHAAPRSPSRAAPLRAWPLRAWLLLLGVGLLDTLAHILLYAGLSFADGQFAMVASSGYTVVTVLLALIFLRERVSPPQWLGIALVVGGIAVLALLG